MALISKEQVDDDMRDWFDQLTTQKQVPSGIPAKAEIKVETIQLHLTQEQYKKFLENPKQAIQQLSSTNATNAASDPLFRG